MFKNNIIIKKQEKNYIKGINNSKNFNSFNEIINYNNDIMIKILYFQQQSNNIY